MRKYVPAALVALPFLIIGCAPAPLEAPAVATYPGFDTWRYPGAETLRTWREASPYRWIGYYLPSPCHRGTTWQGRRAEIEQIGFGIAALYVGQQTWEGAPELEEEPDEIICSRTLLTTEEGRRNGRDAVDKMAAEGFPAGSTVFLNVERTETVPWGMVQYYTAWIAAVLEDGRFVPGTYAHRINAEALFGHARAAFVAAGRTDLPPFWVAGGTGFALDARPEQSGHPYAEIWQGVLDVERTWGDVPLTIDENVASSPYPSAPRVQTDRTGTRR
jgi:hypothetical protein